MRCGGFSIFFYFIDSPDPLRLPEVIIVVCVLLLWCCSIFIFIRHSELLRIRHRDLPYRPTVKAPMNLNHITVVNRTSEMVIHSKRLSAINPAYTRRASLRDEITKKERRSSVAVQLPVIETKQVAIQSPEALSEENGFEEELLDPQLISSEVREQLIELHRKSMENVAAVRYSISYSANDISKHYPNSHLHFSINERYVQESPV